MFTNHRLIGLDIWRGIAIVLMIVYHLFFDLSYFGYLTIDFSNEMFWLGFRYLIISLFLLSVGISLILTHKNKIQWRKVWGRFWRLALIASLVSIGSYHQFPDSWIYFGILHFILLAYLVGLLFLAHSGLALITAILIFLGSSIQIFSLDWLNIMLHQALNLPSRTEDLVPFFPWFAVVLLGIWLGGSGRYRQFFTSNGWHKIPLKNTLSLLGRHSLLIYVIHQPILFAGFFLIEN